MNFTSSAGSCAKYWTHDLQNDEECTSKCGEACHSERNTIKMQSTPLETTFQLVMRFKYEELYVEKITEYHAYTFPTFFSNLGTYGCYILINPSFFPILKGYFDRPRCSLVCWCCNAFSIPHEISEPLKICNFGRIKKVLSRREDVTTTKLW